MKSISLPFLALLLAFSTQAPAEDSPIARAKAKVAITLRDPDSAKFLDVLRSPADADGGGGFVCGWVNAKNSFGAYVGYRPFFVSGDLALVRDDDRSGAHGNHGMVASAWRKCHPSDEVFGDVLVALPKINIDKECEKLRKQARRLGRDNDWLGCEETEKSGRAWLESHRTEKYIAEQCERSGRLSRSFNSTMLCVIDNEMDIVFRRGPGISDASASR